MLTQRPLISRGAAAVRCHAEGGMEESCQDEFFPFLRYFTIMLGVKKKEKKEKISCDNLMQF